MSATRYYTAGSGGPTIAVRQGATLTWLASDHQATHEVAVNSTTTDVTRRRQFPFGAPRGEQQTAWPGERGFVGGTQDASTGLTHLGAREYDPTLGRFLSVDPVMDLSDPQQIHGYTYSNNSPITSSDPTGLWTSAGDNDRRDTGGCKDHCGKPSTSTASPGGPGKPGVEDTIQKFEQDVIKGNSPKSNDPNFLISIWSTLGSPAREDFWNMQIGDGESACFGRTGCRQAWLYILEHPDDILGAKKIAATYCVDNYDECAGEKNFEKFVNVAMYDALMLVGLRAGMKGGASGIYAALPQSGASSVALAAAMDARALARTMPPSQWPHVAAGVVDKTTGQVWKGFSGNPNVAIPKELAEKLPATSAHTWRVTNCAEVAACATALRDGAKLENLVVVAVRVKDGMLKAACKNCSTWVPGVG